MGDGGGGRRVASSRVPKVSVRSIKGDGGGYLGYTAGVARLWGKIEYYSFESSVSFHKS